MSTVAAPYQDEWVRGEVTAPGYRDCADRFEIIRSELAGLRRPFSVLDLGAHSGYFSFRLADEFGACCTVVDDYGRLPGLVERNADPRISLIHQRLGVKQVAALGGFDVILALSVLHHQEHWRWMLATLRGMARSRLIVETPDPTERLRQARQRRSLGAIHDAAAELGRTIGESTGVWDRSKRRPIFAMPGKPFRLRASVFSGSGNHSLMAPRFADELAPLIGYAPFPGSLNLRAKGPVHALLGPPALDFHDETRPGRGRRGGDYQIWPARIEGVECHAMIPGVRHHGADTVEILAPVKLRDALGLEDGSTVSVEVGA